MTMKTEQPLITIRDLVNGYKDSGENGVVAFGGKLNVRKNKISEIFMLFCFIFPANSFRV